jgi:hypothetical protein
METDASHPLPAQTLLHTAGERSRIPTLIACNAVLLAVLSVVTIGGRNPAHADAQGQPGATQPLRSRGAYTAIATPAANGNTSVLAIVDSVNQEMAILAWDKTRRTFGIVGYRSLAADADELIGR